MPGLPFTEVLCSSCKGIFLWCILSLSCCMYYSHCLVRNLSSFGHDWPKISYGSIVLYLNFSWKFEPWLFLLVFFFPLSPWKQLYIKDTSRNWKRVGSDGNSQLTMKDPSTNIVLMDHISTEKWRDIVDFDDHLDDVSKSVLHMPRSSFHTF